MPPPIPKKPEKMPMIDPRKTKNNQSIIDLLRYLVYRNRRRLPLYAYKFTKNLLGVFEISWKELKEKSHYYEILSNKHVKECKNEQFRYQQGNNLV
ncbi:BH1458 [Halalkalibacterium halodurans C-125]|uniref:BH1458 protein n=1 Tax=Halalkalibacterium halodurans (strain ATCC BAA-125 / DSM 18197 / FERM 7344 / JCM 9153 / C-125) TaxID=272558 RepID=Q9KCW0_HALH5|nr:BH1458 [Halalkalibacterium halodurans C-125]